MPADPQEQPPHPHGLARRDPHPGGLMHLRGGRSGPGPGGLFCASPTVLEAINHVLYHRGLPTLWADTDGVIGPSDPLLGRVEYVPSPFIL